MTASRFLVAPSLLACDFGRISDEVAACERAGADLLHLDVMDGHFVPNITFGPALVAAIRKCTKLPLDVHLMIEEPDRYVGAFADAGADFISVHVEAAVHLQRTLASLRKLGVKAGAGLNPATPASALDWVIPDLDFALVMSVNPGFGGQSFLAQAVPKIGEIAAKFRAAGSTARIEVDGGITEETVGEVARQGATILVAGSYVFGASDRSGAIERLRATATRASSSEA